MSIRLVKAVLASAIPHHLKVTAAAMAMYANDRGENIFPAVSTLATDTNKPERSIRRDIVELLELGIVEAETERRRGLRRPTHYVMKPEALDAENSDTGVRSSIEENGQLRPNPVVEERTPVVEERTPVVEERTATSAETDVHVSRSFNDSLGPGGKVSARASSEKAETDHRRLFSVVDSSDLLARAESEEELLALVAALPDALGVARSVISSVASRVWLPKALALVRERRQEEEIQRRASRRLLGS